MRGLAIAAFIVVLCSAAWASSLAPKPPEKAGAAQQGASADHRGTEQSPLVVNIKSIPPPTEEERREKAEERHEKAETDTWLVLLTGVLAVATLALVGATGFLWYATHRLVKGAETTAKRQLRAYLHIGPTQGVYTPNEGPLVAHVTVKNFGQTPAYEVIQWISIVGTSDGDTPIFEDADDELARGVAIIAPGGTTHFEIPTTDNITPRKKSALIDSKATIHIRGEITYRDIFGDSHFTRFRMFLRGDGAEAGKFKASDTGNETDDFPETAGAHALQQSSVTHGVQTAP